jgi:hypothetical protein
MISTCYPYAYSDTKLQTRKIIQMFQIGTLDPQDIPEMMLQRYENCGLAGWNTM